MKTCISAAQIFTERGILEDSSLLIEDGIILGLGDEKEALLLDLSDCMLWPGLIDTHVHGGNGYDMMDGTYAAINEISRFKLKEGVTSFFPTTVTASSSQTKTAIASVLDSMKKGVDGAKIAGIFMEGPYINTHYKGAHPEEKIRSVSLPEIRRWIELGHGMIAAFAIAPELPGADQAISFLKSQNVQVKIGHSAADYDEAEKAIEQGAAIGIHTFNAMTPLHHREPGLTGAILSDDRLYGELICDLTHVHPAAVKIMYRCKGPEKLILVTDCMMAGGLTDGMYRLGEEEVLVKNHTARTSSGALAGSTLNLLDAIKNLYHHVQIPLFDAVRTATLTPAEAMKLDQKIGSIRAGKAADLTAVDSDFNVRMVMVDGVIKYQR